MNHRQKQLSVRLLALTAVLAMAPMQAAWAGAPKAPALGLGSASAFALLGGNAVTCTNGAIIGDVGSGVAYTNTTCPIAGNQPPATDTAVPNALSDFLGTYNALLATPSCVDVAGSLGGVALSPGVYCLDGTANAGVLTLTGPSKGVWIFLVAGALTGTDFTVNMAGGGLPCNVWWAPIAGTTFTDSVLQGNILAGDSIDGSITLTGGTLNGRALADVDVTTTDATVTMPIGAKGCPKSPKSK